jgi:predicted RNA binding protein YcfA (HicA-like mRNA interferase family)
MTPLYNIHARAVNTLSQWDKLIDEILKQNANMRFDDLAKALTKIGYSMNQPKGGSSHYTFRKNGKMPITLPKQSPMNKAYIELVRDAIVEWEMEV